MFQSIDKYNEENDKGFFTLRNDRESAKVIFLYRSQKDVLVGDVHYLVSDSFSGYVHCLGPGCPACAKRIRKDVKIFTPLYNLNTERIEFFDRNKKYWEPQLQEDVFGRYGDDATQVIFSITRIGAAGDRNTRYAIQGTNTNDFMSYDAICQKFNISFPEYYDSICKLMSADEMRKILDSTSSSGGVGFTSVASLPSYSISPRGVTPEAPPVSSVAQTGLPSLPEAEIPEDFGDELPDPDFD